MRHNCNLFRALKMGYVRSMIRWCNANGWKYFWVDTFVNWWRIEQYNCRVCGGINHRDRLGKIGFLVCGHSQDNA